MALLIDIKHPDWMKDDELRAELLRFYPEADIRTGDNPGNLEEIDMLTVSSYFPGEALRYPNLKVIQKTGAGVNNILADQELPESVRVARLQTDTSGAEMAEYALAYVLQEQRHLRQYHQQQTRSQWTFYPPRKARDTTVAVLGLGRIGMTVQTACRRCWHRLIMWFRCYRRHHRPVACLTTTFSRASIRRQLLSISGVVTRLMRPI
jgi:glyoxylate/hydroxypyruvate reductase A